MKQTTDRLNFDEKFDLLCQKIDLFFVVFQNAVKSQIVMCQFKKGIKISDEEITILLKQIKKNLVLETEIRIVREHQLKDQIMLVLELKGSNRQKLDQIQNYIDKPIKKEG